jgi:hypothetical protein
MTQMQWHKTMSMVLLWTMMITVMTVHIWPMKVMFDDCLDVEELMHNVALEVLMQNIKKEFENFEIFDKASRNFLYTGMQ